jgi:hypothetical protein
MPINHLLILNATDDQLKLINCLISMLAIRCEDHKFDLASKTEDFLDAEVKRLSQHPNTTILYFSSKPADLGINPKYRDFIGRVHIVEADNLH